MRNKRRSLILLICLIILLIPLTAMQFTSEVQWSLADFIVAGILLFSTGFVIELVLQNRKNSKHKFVLVTIIVLVLLLVFLELAVGLFGSPFAGS